ATGARLFAPPEKCHGSAQPFRSLAQGPAPLPALRPGHDASPFHQKRRSTLPLLRFHPGPEAGLAHLPQSLSSRGCHGTVGARTAPAPLQRRSTGGRAAVLTLANVGAYRASASATRAD